MMREPEPPGQLADVDSVELSGAELARQWGVTPRALRFYESRGLISPRREGQERIYSQLNSHRVGLILQAKRFGFTLAEIGQLIDVRAGDPSSRDLKLTAEKCLQQISRLQKQMENTLHALADLRRIHHALCCKAANRSEDTSTVAVGPNDREQWQVKLPISSPAGPCEHDPRKPIGGD